MTHLVPLFTVRALSVRMGDRVLFRDLDLDLSAGEIVTVRGPSGSGKTSLLRTLCGLQDPAGGTIELDGRRGLDLGWPQFRRRVALVAQKAVLPRDTVRDNLALGFGYRAATGQTEFPEDRARALLDRLLLEDVTLDADAQALSVGQQQRIALVRSLLIDPQVLLLDEPTSALDAAAAARVADLVRETVTADRSAALIVTHAITSPAWWDRSLDLGALTTATEAS